MAVAVEGVGQEVSGGREGPSLSGNLLLWEPALWVLFCSPRAQLSRQGCSGSSERRQEVWGRECRLSSKIQMQSLRVCHSRPPPMDVTLLCCHDLPCLLSSSCENCLQFVIRDCLPFRAFTCSSSCLGWISLLFAWLASPCIRQSSAYVTPSAKKLSPSHSSKGK